jgi:hypothetical protein
MPAIAPEPQLVVRDPQQPKPTCATEAEAEAWAAEWFAGHTPKHHDPSLYLTLEGLLTQLRPEADGTPPPVRLLRLSWLEAWAQKVLAAPGVGLPLPRRQELERNHPEAFLSEDQVVALPRGDDPDDTDQPLRLIALSHSWLTSAHPDPRGEQLVQFVEQVRHERRLCPRGPVDLTCACSWLCPLANPWLRDEQGRMVPWVAATLIGCYPATIGMSQGCTCGCVPMLGQGCCRSATGFPTGEAAVFYDFASLMQKDERGERTAAEKAAYGRALDTMGAWYAHRLTTTFSMSVLPQGWDVTPYTERGWTSLELAVSDFIKPSHPFSWRRLVDPAVVRRPESRPSAYRKPPLHPLDFAALLARKKFPQPDSLLHLVLVDGQRDCELVAGIYADTLRGTLGGVADLEFESCGWGDEELEKLAQVLAFAEAAESISLASNPRIGAQGLGVLAAVLREGAAPKLLKIKCDHPRSAQAAALRAACEARGIELV